MQSHHQMSYLPIVYPVSISSRTFHPYYPLSDGCMHIIYSAMFIQFSNGSLPHSEKTPTTNATFTVHRNVQEFSF